jgi:hypothetical protein
MVNLALHAYHGRHEWNWSVDQQVAMKAALRAAFDAAPDLSAREWSDAEIDKRMVAVAAAAAIRGNDDPAMYRAIFRAGLAAAAPAKEPQHPPQDAPDVAALVARLQSLMRGENTAPGDSLRKIGADAAAALTAMARERDHIKQVEFPRRIDAVTKTFRERADKAEAERDKLRELLRAACSTLETKHVMSMASGQVQKWRKDDAALKGEA